MSNVVQLNIVHPYFPPGTWKVLPGVNPATYRWSVLQKNGPWTTSIAPGDKRLLITNSQTHNGWVYALQPSPNAPKQASNRMDVKLSGLGAVADDTPTGTGFDSGDSTQTEANPTPDVPDSGGGGGSAPIQPSGDTSPTVSTSGDPTTLLWVLGGLVLVAGSLAAYTYSKKSRRGGKRRKTSRHAAHRRRR